MSIATESFTQPYRLEPFQQEENKPKDKPLPFYHVFQIYIKQLKNYGIPVSPEMQDF